ncbi:hypothetical protein V6N11_058727 [Hibiscus sabdariffa]|uniref:Uncharacterized protein n=1 Tax=Hibiscus sabdariffa TaxID=183260 RepID=A0ABR2U537_9ROSI
MSARNPNANASELFVPNGRPPDGVVGVTCPLDVSGPGVGFVLGGGPQMDTIDVETNPHGLGDASVLVDTVNGKYVPKPSFRDIVGGGVVTDQQDNIIDSLYVSLNEEDVRPCNSSPREWSGAGVRFLSVVEDVEGSSQDVIEGFVSSTSGLHTRPKKKDELSRECLVAADWASKFASTLNTGNMNASSSEVQNGNTLAAGDVNKVLRVESLTVADESSPLG